MVPYSPPTIQKGYKLNGGEVKTGAGSSTSNILGVSR